LATEQRRLELLEKLVLEHQARLRAYVCSRTGDRELADDIVQDVFMIAYRKIDTLDLTTSLFPWLVSVARSQISQRWRSKDHAVAIDEVADFINRKLSNEYNADEAPKFETQFDRLRKCVERLPAKLRSLVDMIYRDDLSCDEASVALGMNCNTVRVTLHRARKTLRDCVQSKAGN
jgi:RNA polymerase sigma-70 factor, ECF subfamily